MSHWAGFFSGGWGGGEGDRKGVEKESKVAVKHFLEPAMLSVYGTLT